MVSLLDCGILGEAIICDKYLYSKHWNGFVPTLSITLIQVILKFLQFISKQSQKVSAFKLSVVSISIKRTY